MMLGEKSMRVYTIVHEHFEEIFRPKAPTYGRSLFVLNSYHINLKKENQYV